MNIKQAKIDELDEIDEPFFKKFDEVQLSLPLK
jgi:hypothetical protein